MTAEEVAVGRDREILNEVLNHGMGATEYVYAVMLADAFGKYGWDAGDGFYDVAEDAIEMRDEHRGLGRQSIVVRAPIGKPGTWEVFE